MFIDIGADMINQWKSRDLTNLFSLYDDHIERRYLYPKLETFIDLESPCLSVLDFGCGAGKFMEYICYKRELNMTGCDISEDALILAKERINGNHLINIADGFTKLYNTTFDLVFCNFLFVTYQDESLIKKDMALISNILQSGGKLIVSDFNPNSVGIDFETFMAGEKGRKYKNGDEITCRMKTTTGEDFEFVDYFWSIDKVVDIAISVGLRKTNTDYILIEGNAASPFYILDFIK